MGKKRLEVWLDEEEKDLLHLLAEAEGISVSDLIRELVADRLSAAGMFRTGDPYNAVEDSVRIMKLRAEFAWAYSRGMVYSFSRYCELAKAGKLPDGAAWTAFVYDDREALEDYGDSARFAVVADKLVDENHEDIISTYTGQFRCADVHLVSYDDIEGAPYDLEVVPKWQRGDWADGLSLGPFGKWPGEAAGD